jgi:hypothetical protein
VFTDWGRVLKAGGRLLFTDPIVVTGPITSVLVLGFFAYGGALPQLSNWYRRSWATTVKSLIDSLLYGAVTGAILAWLWP